MTLIFVRHGESTGNVRRIAQGWLDVPLTDLGRRQAAAAAERLAAEPVAALYSSDLGRATETAVPIGVAHGLTAEPRPALREQRFGEAQGLNWTEIVERWGADVRVGAGSIPGEETGDAFSERVAVEFEWLAARHRDGVAVCVAHGGTVRAVVAHVLGLPRGTVPPVHVANGSLTVVSTARGGPVLLALNDSCHLRGADGSGSG